MKMHRTTLLAVLAPVAAAYNADANNVHLQFASSPSGSVSPEAVEEARPEEHLQLLEEHLVTVDLPNFDTAEAILGQFEEWVGRHSKSYESMEERARRMLVWADNHVMIETHNNKPEQSSFTLGHNQFSDQTHDEFQRLMGLGPYSPELQHSDTKVWNFMEDEEAASDEHEGGLRGAPPAAVATERRLSSSFTPDDNGGIDWHLKGLMGYVRNQGLCGACWAFSAIGSIESSMAIDKFNDMTPDEQRALSESKMSAVSGETLVDNDLGLVVPLSEQNLIDCDTLREKGCEGGLMVTDFDEEEVKNGICAETDYPYLQTQGTCASSMCTPVPGSIVKDHVDLVPRKTNNLVTALKKKPVTAAMVANEPMFQFYSSGIFTSDTCGKVTKEMGTPDCKMLYPGQDVCLPDINHGVLVVGYGTDKTVEGDGPKDYFKVKNSWGNAWGEGGYFRLARSETDPADPKGNWGMCAILTLLSYPEMK